MMNTVFWEVTPCGSSKNQRFGGMCHLQHPGELQPKHAAKKFISPWRWRGARRSIVVKALCYKPEGRGFETRWCERFLSIYLILPAALGPGVYSASNKNEYQKHKNIFFWEVKQLPVRRADNVTAICEPIV
jgi:hypothetical protein